MHGPIKSAEMRNSGRDVETLGRSVIAGGRGEMVQLL